VASPDLRVALLLCCCTAVAGCLLTGAAAGGSGSAALHTAPGLHPPTLKVDHRAQGAAPRYVFLAEKGGKSQPSGVVIADDRGRIVWYHEVPAGLEATDFRAQT